MMSTESGAPRAGSRVLNFSTATLPVNGRVELWEGHNSRALIPLDIRTLDDAPMHATQANLVLPSVRMANVSGSAQIVERNESFIRENPTGVVAVFFALEGEGFFLHGEGMLQLRPGQAVVYHGDRPFTRGFPHGLREMVLTIPEAEFAAAFGVSLDRLPFVFDFGPGTGATEQALPRLLADTLRSGVADAPAVAVAEEQLRALLHRALTSSNSSAVGLVTTAKDVIERSYADPDLTVSAVAAAVGISQRQLARAFAEQGSSVSGYVRSRRVALAQSILANPLYQGMSMAEIGSRCGFSSQAAFSRAFKEESGSTPLQWRKERGRGTAGG